jgi:hypothetical protein
VVHRPSPSDKVGARQTETRGAGPTWANFIGLRLVRATSPTFAKALDLAPNLHRQNGTYKTRHELARNSFAHCAGAISGATSYMSDNLIRRA